MNSEVTAKEVVFSAFSRSLENLGIDSNRYRGLPRAQRRLALCEAINSTARKLLPSFEPLRETGFLPSRKPEDFSPEQLRSHKTFVDAAIALACLGENSVVRHLINYLSFPEPRWRMVIEPVLRSLCQRPPKGSLAYQIPSKRQVEAWCEWALMRSAAPQCTDYTSDILAESFTSASPLRRLKTTFYSPRLECWNTHALEFKYYNAGQAEFARKTLEHHILANDYHQVVNHLDDYIRSHHASSIHFGTLSAAISDCFQENYIENSLSRWLEAIDRIKPHAITFHVFYYSLPQSQRSRRLARKFSQSLAKTYQEPALTVALTDLFDDTKETRFEHIIDAMLTPLSSQRALKDLGAVIAWRATDSIRSRFASEVQNLILLHSIPEKRRDRFADRLRVRFTEDDKVFGQLCRFVNVKNDELSSIGAIAQRLLEARKLFNDALATGVLFFGDKLLSKFTKAFNKISHQCEENAPSSE